MERSRCPTESTRSSGRPRSRCPGLPIQHHRSAPVDQQIAFTGGYVGNPAGTGFWEPATPSTPMNRSSFPALSNTNLDRPYYAKYGWTQGLSYYCDCSNARYNSFQGQVKINAWAGWTLQASYTYQRAGDGGATMATTTSSMAAPAGLGYGSLLPRQQWTFAQIL